LLQFGGLQKEVLVLEKARNHWKRIVAYVGVLPTVLWVSLKWPYMVVGLATIPVDNYISKKFNMPPTISKFAGLAIFFILLTVSWWSLELIVVLAALALSADVMLLAQKISQRIQNEQHA
jgi:uncharacterized membrane protein